MTEKAKKWLRILLILLWAFAFAQGPQYMDLYFQNLTGHVEELKFQVRKLEDLFDVSQLDLKETLEKVVESTDEMASKQGGFLLDLVERYQSLSRSWDALYNASAWSRPFIFMSHFSMDIGSETSKHFTFGLPVTWDGIIYFIVGGFAGWGVFSLLAFCLRKMKALFSKKEPKN